MNPDYWQRARDFHGHECPGLAIGVKACEAAVEKMGISPSFDEELVCITETDACGVDAIQVLMSCTLGKGNLIYRGFGKQAFTFLDRGTGRAMRFYFKASNPGMERSDFQSFLLNAAVEALFDYQVVDVAFPEHARIFASLKCEICGESAAEPSMRVREGKFICLSCADEYSRGW